MFDYFIDYYVNLQYGITYVFTEVFLCVVIGLTFSEIKKPNKRAILFTSLDAIATWIVFLFLQSIFYCIAKYTGVISTFYTRFYIWPLVCLIHVFVPFDKSKISFRIVYAVLLSTFINVMLSASSPLGAIVRNALQTSNNIFSDMTFITILLLSGVLLVILKFFSLENYNNINPLYILILVIAYSLSYAMITAISLLSNETDIVYPLIELCVFAIDLLFYFVFHLSIKDNNNAQIQEAKNLLYESELSQVGLLEEKLEEMHEIRHEMKNLFSLMNELIKNKKYDELEKMFSDLYETTTVTMNYADTGNPVVNAIINVELTKAIQSDVTINYKAAIPKTLGISKEDLYHICLNILDNAIESLTREGLKGPIEFSIRKDESFLFINCENPIDPSKMENNQRLSLVTLKKEKGRRHGYGTQIIKQKTTALNGAYKFYIEKNMFCVDIMIPLKEGENE